MTTERTSCVPAGIRQALEAQIASGRDNPLGRLTLGRILFSEENFDGAIQHLRHALQLDPANAAVYVALGKAYDRKGELVLARDVFLKGQVVAEQGGDLQAARQIEALRRRLPAKV
ncbi:tetratricopeptide repeat protein [Martelella sp. HB161492]|uniref:tetratricopeptide repeat protein n=1 Tax=Martelella sp. HB161492 TaxID=2720726 RepID=UPI0015912A9C|nr:tetratricopeptide repeat protein [Martelella sp. HB161492]